MVPPLVGVAVKVTLVPAQMVCAPAVIAMLTLAGKFGLTEKMDELPVVVLETQPLRR